MLVKVRTEFAQSIGGLFNLQRLSAIADVDKILTQIKKMDDRINAFKVSLEDRESNKTVALGTSK